ncbi:hypothetical protein NLX83_21640 [Allokutzneria sp. A3M-2-11 16]|uniref:DNA-3-methyladenine glycosylase family protein n=1 Tax=Allokutzneria sp. A3M-2-11 16 TaxID=2962043 RepID=UPI0020B657AB|nr:hypothetical protein [Allokutzneria sp. A3M-2-11 16]MCP3801873.1 hypothetical protein [Allokutzneria sp. A3M-2-11 16]
MNEARKGALMTGLAMLDHPAWRIGHTGTAVRAVRVGDAVWLALVVPDGGIGCALARGSESAPSVDVFAPASVSGPAELIGPLCEAGPVVRLRNPDLWDALGTSVIRQVISAPQARKLHRMFCEQFGDRIDTPHGPVWLFPSPETVLGLPDRDIDALGLKFHRPKLRTAARAYGEFGQKWAELEPARLVTEVQGVRGIGPWTAAATGADVSNDFALYPYTDLAVRKWARHIAPSLPWPDTKDVQGFGALWKRWAGERLSELTALTLAWGVRHAAGAAV